MWKGMRKKFKDVKEKHGWKGVHKGQNLSLGVSYI